MVQSTDATGGSESVQDSQETQEAGKGKRNTDPHRLVDTNINKLKDSEPEFYQAMLMGMAQEMCNKSKKGTENLKRIRKEYERR